MRGCFKRIVKFRHCAGALLAVALAVAVTPADAACDAGPAGTPPAPAQKAGYTAHTFSATLARKAFDMSGKNLPGFQWYPYALTSVTADMKQVQFNSDGTLTLLGDNNTYGGSISTVLPTFAGSKFHGCAFGGGAYIEARFKFNPKQVVWNLRYTWGHPSFWAMPVEHTVYPTNDQWPNAEPGYEHFGEIDVLEFDISNQQPSTYGGTVHDWYGIFGTCGGTYCQQIPPQSQNTDVLPCRNQTCMQFSDYHTYGMLWIPATATTKGSATYYFDGKQLNPNAVESWTQYVPTSNTQQTPSPAYQPWCYGILDVQHFEVILGTPATAPLQIKSIDVWQASGSNNLSVP